MTTRQYNASKDRDRDRDLLGQFPRSYFSYLVPSSRSGSKRRKNNSPVSSLKSSIGPEPTIKEEAPTAWIPSWVPYTFTHIFLAILSLSSLALCLITFLLWWISSTHYGLGPDNGSSAMLFGWRYSPTMIAVIYVQMTAVLFEDVKRTEPFARLARPEGSSAPTSILKTPGAWWNALYDGFAKKKNGRRSWVLVCATLVNILGFMGISSLSSAYLFSDDVVVPKSTDFLTLSPAFNSPLPIDADRATHFRTIANLLQNVSTSPWITDEYTILPFWPSSLQDAPITSLPSTSSQTWRADTVMFKSELTCTPMSIQSQANETIQYTKGVVKVPSISIVWESSDGCEYGLAADTDFFNMGGGSWSDVSTFYYAEMAVESGVNTVFSTNHTKQCDGKEIIIVTDSWESADAKYGAQLCDTSYYMANVTTTIALTGDDPVISFNETEFEKNKVTIPDILLNTTEFRSMMLDSDWPTYMISILWSQTAMMGGPTILLGALYDYNMTALVNDPDWVSSAAKAQQRYFGEVLQAALTQQGASQKITMEGVVRDVKSRVVVQPGAAIALGILFAISFFLVLFVWWSTQLQRRPLNLNRDPATTIGTACLISDNPLVRSAFQSFKQPSQKDMDEALGDEWFCTDSYGLCRLHTDNPIEHNTRMSENGTPMLLRLPAILGLITILAVVISGIIVLYHFAEGAGLYEKAFVYQVQVSLFNSGVSSVAPFSMIPTLIATGIGLWWGAIDDNFRRLTPFLEMSRENPQLSRGAALSYQSSFWLWACMKAAFNKHWLLSILTFGSSLSPIFTTSMSALFDRSPGDVTKSITFNKTLEIRDIPLVFSTSQSLYPGSSDDYAGAILAELYTNLSSHWMYTAAIQLTLNGSEPSWSKDGWSFVPVELNDLDRVDLPNNLDESDQTLDGPTSNISFTTPAIRGRIECSEYPATTLTNLSIWLTPTALTNHTIWNASTIPHNLEGGYQLGAVYSELPSAVLPITSSENITTCPNCTTIFVNPAEIICCGNGSSSSWDPSIAVGYWSPNTDPATWTVRNWQRNFTAKWFHGNAVTGIKRNENENGYYDADLLFPKVPSVTMMNCRPLIEAAEASITVNPDNGEIQSYNITSTPSELTEAFSDNFLPHNQTSFSQETGIVYYNVTLSYGRLFMASMLTAADTLHLGGASHVGGYSTEDLDDNTYNIRDTINGLNMDFMSYSMYMQANKDPTALLNPTRFTTLAEKTFSTFFQHFASNDVSLLTGGWTYQEINASLPTTLGPALVLGEDGLPSDKVTSYQDTMHPISHTNRTVSAEISQRVELLQMNTVAVWLSVSIMIWLIFTTIIVAILQRRYFGSLVRNVECLGDILVLIAGSANFLQVVREIESGKLVEGAYENLRTRLGWFVDEDGGLRWGIEMEERYRDGPGVHWVSEPEYLKEKGGVWNIRDGEENL
ncbi:uncharacterized protein N7483_000183 [Penicillium malachiteum]|uniref:uncharacterized protein n=1 Tax=Penicillium malachiteum TaxID=1324776 RepID=UPI002548A586|nr:uncharacterized protein N7483_000183 [Penicillium malachiteum]KAJ5735058.1 hypothetical protein N7483_000183 [Penicillium malachiteum]